MFIAAIEILFLLSDYLYNRHFKKLKQEISNLKEENMETQNETQQAQEEITHPIIDPKISPTTIDPAMNDLQMIRVKDFVHVDPDMIPFNDLQMTRDKYLTIKLILKSYNSHAERPEDFANRLIAFARGE